MNPLAYIYTYKYISLATLLKMPVGYQNHHSNFYNLASPQYPDIYKSPSLFHNKTAIDTLNSLDPDTIPAHKNH